MTLEQRARRIAPAGSPDHPGRGELRALRDSIRARREHRGRAQAERLTSARAAAARGALLREVVAAAGVSRTYLHRMGVGAVREATSADFAAALERARRHRDELAELDALDAREKARRRAIALELLDAGMPEKAIAGDAGVTQEWVRRRFTDG